MQENIRSYLSSLHSAMQSHDPYHMEGYNSYTVSDLCGKGEPIMGEAKAFDSIQLRGKLVA